MSTTIHEMHALFCLLVLDFLKIWPVSRTSGDTSKFNATESSLQRVAATATGLR